MCVCVHACVVLGWEPRTSHTQPSTAPLSHYSLAPPGPYSLSGRHPNVVEMVPHARCSCSPHLHRLTSLIKLNLLSCTYAKRHLPLPSVFLGSRGANSGFTPGNSGSTRTDGSVFRSLVLGPWRPSWQCLGKHVMLQLGSGPSACKAYIPVH